MKKIFLFLCLFGIFSVVEQVNAQQYRYWPGYIDNSDCERMKECGKMVNIFADDGKIYVGGRNSLLLQNTQKAWKNGTGAQSTHSIKPLVHVEMRDISAVQPDQGKYGVYLKDGQGNHTEYRLKGFPTENTALNVRAWLCDVSRDAELKCTDKDKYVDYRFTLADLIKGSYSKDIHTLNNREAIGWLEVWVNGKDYRLASDDAFGVRSIQLPGIWIYIQTERFNQYGNKIPYDNYGSYTILLSDKIARLNHRQCKLTLNPDKPVYFGNLSVTDDQEGQIGTTRETQVHLSCGGSYNEYLFSGGTKILSDGSSDPTVNVLTLTPVSGKKAVHVVEEMKITAGTPVMINNENKIGLTLQGSNSRNNTVRAVPNPNIYVEGSLDNTPFCGTKNKPLPLDVDLKQHSLVKSFENKGEPDNAIGPRHINTFYWKLCKKNGEVEGGKYKGTATISIKYK